MKTIKVTIDADGSPPVIEASGFSGSDCLKATLDFVKAFGGAKSSTKKPEFHQTAKATVKQ